MGPNSRDQEQWSFPPNIRLTAREKRMIVATIMKIAVLVLFRTHVYEFGGKFFLQKKGGPIGYRPKVHLLHCKDCDALMGREAVVCGGQEQPDPQAEGQVHG